MKRWLKFFTVIALLGGIGGAGYWWWDDLLRVYGKWHVKKFTVDLPPCDRVEISVFTDAKDPDKQGEFPVRTGFGPAAVKRTLILTGAEAEGFAQRWRDQSFGYQYVKLCFSPAVGLRFYSGEKLHFETVVCFACSNFEVDYVLRSKRDDDSWGYHGFDADGPRGQALLEHLKSLFPDLAAAEGR
jgi:hypothetical protein